MHGTNARCGGAVPLHRIDANCSVLPIINDPARRIYRGVDPSLRARDRVEVVSFSKPGTYLVICGVLPHFQEGMYGYVRVLP